MKILFLTYYWPPSGRASLHWPLGLIRNFPKHDVTPIVLTIDNDNFTQKDSSLIPLIPSDLQVFKSKANDPFKFYKKFIGKKDNEPLVSSEVISSENKSIAHKISVWLRMNLFIPDARIGWYFSAVKKGIEIFKNDKYDLIISIGPPHSTHLIARKISKKLNLPFIPVLIDPWVDIAYYKGQKRSWLTKKIDYSFEKKVMQDAKQVIFVTENTQKDFVLKYDFIKNKSNVLYWGYNEEDFARINISENKSEEKTILHAGNIFDFQNPVEFWKYIKFEISNGRKLKLKFVGTVSPGVRSSITENGLEKITEYLGFLPYKNVLTEMMKSDYLLVVASEQRHLPGKLFEYCRTGKKIIAFNDENDEVLKVLNIGNFGIQLPLNYSGKDIFEKLDKINPNPEASKIFSRELIAEKFAEIIKKQI